MATAQSGESRSEALVTGPGAPQLQYGDAPFIFVSYAHRDASVVFPHLKRLIDCGYQIWYDGGIPGGAEWDATIEDRIKRCALVLLFGTKAAINSKYVRREVKFADVLDKPLVTVVLEDLRLDYGMGMLLTQYQRLDGRAADFFPRLEHAVRPARSSSLSAKDPMAATDTAVNANPKQSMY